MFYQRDLCNLFYLYLTHLHTLSHSTDNSDLYFKINPDGLGGSNISEHGFAYLWASARATWGIKGGKHYYEMRVEEDLEVDLPDTEEHPHAIRLVCDPFTNLCYSTAPR